MKSVSCEWHFCDGFHISGVVEIGRCVAQTAYKKTLNISDLRGEPGTKSNMFRGGRRECEAGMLSSACNEAVGIPSLPFRSECDDHPVKIDERVGGTVFLPSLDCARTINLRKSVASISRIA